MISRITIDPRYTVTQMKSTLSDLDNHMTRYDSNVTQFNKLVKGTAACTQGLGYLKLPNSQSFQWIKGHHGQPIQAVHSSKDK